MFAADETDDGVLLSKIIAGSALFSISILFGIAPFKLAQVFKWTEPIDPSSRSSKKSAKVVSALLCFGGGVLLATTFLHLLPDINSEIHDLQAEGKIPELFLSLGEVLMMCGFFLIYLIEEIVHYYLHRYQEKLRKSQMSLASTMKTEEETIAEAFMRGVSARHSIHRQHSDNDDIQMNSRRGSVVISDSDTKALSIIEKGQQQAGTDEREKNHINQVSHNNIKNCNNNNNGISKHQHSHNHGHSHTAALPVPQSDDEDMLVSSLRGLLIVLALSIHELFEGFAVGLQKSSYGVYYMFGAVCAHKFVISFCIGVELMVQKTKIWLAFIYVFMYSIVSALGNDLF